MAARYIVMANATWSTQAARDAALTRMNDAITSYNTKNGTSLVAETTLPTNTSISVTIDTGEDHVLSAEMFNGAYASWTQTGRFVSGWMSISRIT